MKFYVIVLLAISICCFCQEETTTAPTTMAEEEEPQKTGCSIWCWIQKIAMFVVSQLLSASRNQSIMTPYLMLTIIGFTFAARPHGFSGTMVDFTDPKVQGHLDALVRMAQSCVIKVRASPKDVRAYFTNSPPITRSGQCFAACMMEQSDVINHGKVNRELLIHLASLVNGKNSRVVRKLYSISRLCLDSIEGMSDRCQLASTYNDCLNENMIEFAFPLDIAEEAVRKMPFHLIQPNLPQELRQTQF